MLLGTGEETGMKAKGKGLKEKGRVGVWNL
jgi:hypothetical protein